MVGERGTIKRCKWERTRMRIDWVDNGGESQWLEGKKEEGKKLRREI